MRCIDAPLVSEQLITVQTFERACMTIGVGDQISGMDYSSEHGAYIGVFRYEEHNIIADNNYCRKLFHQSYYNTCIFEIRLWYA